MKTGSRNEIRFLREPVMAIKRFASTWTSSYIARTIEQGTESYCVGWKQWRNYYDAGYAAHAGSWTLGALGRISKYVK